MRKMFILGAAALLLFIWSGQTATAKDVVLNNGFEMKSILYWTEWGNIPSGDRGVEDFDITGSSGLSPAYYLSPWTSYSGGLKQDIFVQAGVTYQVTIDCAYYNC